MPSNRIDFYAFVAQGYELEIRKAVAGNKDKPDVKKIIDGKTPFTITKESHEIQTAYPGQSLYPQFLAELLWYKNLLPDEFYLR